MWCQRAPQALAHRHGWRPYVNTKLSRRRKEWMSKTYPRSSTEEPKRLPRRGRVGGWMQRPSLGVAQLEGTNSAQQAWWEDHAREIDQHFAQQAQAIRKSGTGFDVQDVFDKHLAELDELRVSMPSAEEFRLPHIKKLAAVTKTNPVHEMSASSAPLVTKLEPDRPAFVGDSMENRRQRRGRFLGLPKWREQGEDASPPEGTALGAEASAQPAKWHKEHCSDESGSSSSGEEEGPESPRGRQSARGRQGRGVALPRAAPPEPMEPLRTTSLSALWTAHGASWAEFNRCVVPSTFPAPEDSELLTGATLSAYQQVRRAAGLFDISYKVGLRVTGADREFVADQFLTCNLRGMRPGDVQYGCVLDSKGLVMDDAFVYLTADSVEILTSGCHALQLTNYLGQYVVYVRRSGADVALELSPRTAAIALQGPRSREALVQALRYLQTGPVPPLLATPDAEGVVVAPGVLEAMPYMSFLVLREGSGGGDTGASAILLCAGGTGEDGFEILAPPGQLLERLATVLLGCRPLVQPAGIYCLDVLRMEAGLPRMGADIPSGLITPIRASLAWTLDQSKMRHHLMFGWRNLFFQLAKGPKYRRVGLLLDGPAHAGCRVLSNPHRQPIGTLATTAWSPALECRVAMAYVRAEYAKVNKHVMLNVPYNLPTHKMRTKAIKGYISGQAHTKAMRATYRRLVAACVVPLPFQAHRYLEPERQRKAAARLRRFAPESQATGEREATKPAPAPRLAPVSERTSQRFPAKPEQAADRERASDLASV